MSDDKYSRFLRHGDYSTRFDLSRPHVRGGWKYYTDGRIVCRTVCLDEEHDATRQCPTIETLPWNLHEDFTPEQMPELPLGKPCESCEGAKEVREKLCVDCKGGGLVVWTAPSGTVYEEECQYCGELGYVPDSSAEPVPCRDCRATGRQLTPVLVSGKPFSLWYLLAINSLPNSQVMVSEGFLLFRCMDNGMLAQGILTSLKDGSVFVCSTCNQPYFTDQGFKFRGVLSCRECFDKSEVSA